MKPRTNPLTREEQDVLENDFLVWRTRVELKARIDHYARTIGPILAHDPRAKSFREAEAMYWFMRALRAKEGRWSNEEPADFRLYTKGEDIPVQLVDVLQENTQPSAWSKEAIRAGFPTPIEITGPEIIRDLPKAIGSAVGKKASKGYPNDIILAVHVLSQIRAIMMNRIYYDIKREIAPFLEKFRAVVVETGFSTQIFEKVRGSATPLTAFHPDHGYTYAIVIRPPGTTAPLDYRV